MGFDLRTLPAYILANDRVPDMIRRFIDTDDIDVRAAYMADYIQMPEEMQCALGYMRCLVESSFWSAYSAYGQFSMEWFARRRVPPMRLPLRFIGWAGPHNDIGPAYEIDPASLSGGESRLFYTDDDIRNRPEDAEELAGYIAGQSTGIEEVRAEKLNALYTLSGAEGTAHSGVTFQLSDAARRSILIGGRETDRGEHGGAIFVLPKAGEFNCAMGEVIGGDLSQCVILAKHMYCMK